MSLDIEAIESHAKATNKLVAALGGALGDLQNADDEKEVFERLQKLFEARENLDDALAKLSTLCGQPPPTTFADFLSDVGDAAVATQRKLDEQNTLSAQLALAAGQVPSGVFRLPSVKGEVKFGFSKTSGKKLGMVFYSRKTSEESRNEQSMQFEIVSTPPPPELLQSAARQLDFTLRPEFDPRRRAEVLKVFRTPVPGYAENTAIPERLLSRIVILHDLEPERYFLFYAEEDATTGNEIGIWRVDLRDDSMQVVWKVASKGAPKENIDLLRLWILALGKRQEELLKSLGQ